MTVTIQLPDEQAERLAEAAREQGVDVDELLRRIASEYLTRKGAFEGAARYVLAKNAELYRRLAK